MRSDNLAVADRRTLIIYPKNIGKNRVNLTPEPGSAKLRHGASLPSKVHLQARLRMDFYDPEGTEISSFGSSQPIG
jgi:hypothetical protein